MREQMSEYLFCCLSPQQQEDIRQAITNKECRVLYQYQENLRKEGKGYRCTVCGAFYPFLQIQDGDVPEDPATYARPTGRLIRYKKAAVIFCGDHYYAHSKKMLLRFELDTAHNAQPTDAIPLIGEVYHIIASPDEQYIATETIKGTIAVTDTRTKKVIAQKRRCSINGAFAFRQDNRLLYFADNAVRQWDFFRKEEQICWKVPGEWTENNASSRVLCNQVIFCAAEQTHVFQFSAGNSTYILLMNDTVPERLIRLPAVPVLHQLTGYGQPQKYTLVTNENVVEYDTRFQVTGTFAYPTLTKISDGGGFFPVTCMTGCRPCRAILSPDGEWVLLDYFTTLILMKRSDQKIRFCLFSHTGRTITGAGFLDALHFWYVWGDSTYVQEITAEK